MSAPFFTPNAMDVLTHCYPEMPAKLTHNLVGHPLLTLDALVQLGAALPEASVEYNPGNLPIGIKVEDVPSPKLSITDTIRSIEENSSWMVLKRVEQDPAYAKLMHDVLGEITELVKPRTGMMLGEEAFVFISSPNSVTPFHFDPEHNILMQIRGHKTMHVFPANDQELVSDVAHEHFHMGEHHRNQPWKDDFAVKANPIYIKSGEAIHVPVKAPHWVQNGDQVSISLSLTWRSEWSYAEADARGFNHFLRGMGLNPSTTGRYPVRNSGKALAGRVVRRVKGLAG
jgi:hypothetical protein